MNMTRTWTSIVAGLLAWGLPTIALAQISADDFCPVIKDGAADVKQPDQVTVKGDTVTAATAQDAINAAISVNLGELESDLTAIGTKHVKFPSGWGYVATGMASYRAMENPVATRISKRKAYVAAFVQAKAHLAEFLSGSTNQAKEAIRQELVNINLPKEEMTNLQSTSEESIRQAVEMMLRGFVIYEVKDDVENRAVFVSIASTPKTVERATRPTPYAIEVDDLYDGLGQVIDEVKNALVPPVGSRIVVLRATGEPVFVGFGSAVVRTSENSALQNKLKLSALKVAQMRAKDGLCGLVAGDRTIWQGSVDQSTREVTQEFESLDVTDPLARKDPTKVRKLGEAHDEFVDRYEETSEYKSFRAGILPPGVELRPWFDDDQAWAYAMAVYAPSASKAAGDFGKKMEGGRSGFLPGTGAQPKRPPKDVGRGPTGRLPVE